MQFRSGNELRENFLGFFEEREIFQAGLLRGLGLVRRAPRQRARTGEGPVRARSGRSQKISGRRLSSGQR